LATRVIFAGGVLQTTSSTKSLVPPDYVGREQTWLKHQVLHEYFQSWAFKVASSARYGKVKKIWYVDTFAGPWRSNNAELQDTSISIGLKVLETAANYWRQNDADVEIGAIFIEKNANAFSDLKSFLDGRNLNFKTHAFQGAFSENLKQIQKLIGNDPAFCFVDPTGWKGAEMGCIKQLVSGQYRDVLINFMFDYVNRFVNHKEGSQYEEMQKFFGADVPEDLDEEGLMKFYQDQLKETCGLRYAANLIVEDPLRDRTKFRLVVGGNHSSALKLFRDIEKRVVLARQPAIVAAAREDKRSERTGQLSLLGGEELAIQPSRGCGLCNSKLPVVQVYEKLGPISFERFYPLVLEECHITFGQLKEILWDGFKAGHIIIDNAQGDRAMKDYHFITAIKPSFLSEAIIEPVQEALF
jgi:three-Cys-motif partner protein